MGAAAVMRPPPITVSTVERVSRDLYEQPPLADNSEVPGTLGNVLEGDLSQLAEKLHKLEPERFKQFVEDLRTAFREVALEPSDLPSDIAEISAPVSPRPDEIEHAAAELEWELADRVATEVATSSGISEVVSPSPDGIQRSAEVPLEASDRLPTHAATSPEISAPVSSPPDEIEHGAAEIAWDPDGCLAAGVATASVISAEASPSDGILHSTEEVPLEPRDRLGADNVTSPVISAPMSSSPDEIEHAAAETASDPDDYLSTDVATASVISAVVSPSLDGIQHSAKEIPLEPLHRRATDVATSPVISAPVSQPLDEIEHGAAKIAWDPDDHLAVDIATASVISAVGAPSLNGNQHSAEEGPSEPRDRLATGVATSPRGRSRWGKRTGFLLALSAATASIPWEWPVLFPNLPQSTSVNRELVAGRDARESSQRGQPAEEIAPVEEAVAPTSQAPSQPLPAGDIEALIDRGDQLFRQGDIIAARSFYERAAASGSARAANGVARTFDPLFLSSLGVIGIRGDPERAATWYRKCEPRCE